VEKILSIIFISVVGTLLHFIYDFSKHNKIVGLFTAVNESTWEHIKIALTPAFLWSIYDFIVYKDNPNYFIAKFVSLIIIVLLIPIIFYTYKSIIKDNVLIIDIAIFYIAIIISRIFFYYILKMEDFGNVVNCIGFIFTILLFIFYITATIIPPRNFLFKDPLTNKYGFKGHLK
jgi:hypothetical protein